MISLIIRDGSFLEVQIFTIDDTGIERVFTNPSAPIGINSRRIHRGDKLTFQRRNNDCYNIFTTDIWQFRFLNSFVPEDSILTITKEEYIEIAYTDNEKHIGIPLYRGTNINSLFDVAVFTDGLSLFGNESNGLLLTDFRFQQVLHQKNFRNSSFYTFKNLRFRLRLTKFDSEFSTLTFNENRNVTVLQQSWLRSDMSLSIVNFPIAFKSLSSGELYVNSGVLLTEIFDSEQNSESETKTSTLISTGLKIDLLFASNSGLLFDVSGGRHFTPNISNMDYSWFGEVSAEMFWNPLGNDSGRLFGKVVYTMDEHANDFFQLNLGYRVMFSKLIASQ